MGLAVKPEWKQLGNVLSLKNGLLLSHIHVGEGNRLNTPLQTREHVEVDLKKSLSVVLNQTFSPLSVGV